MLKFPCHAATAAALVLFAAHPVPAFAGISGVCPDGSIYIVQTAAQIPCRESKQVEPSEMPPLRPSHLPTPYTWQVWNQRHDPNNPYNVIDSAEQVRGYEAPQVQGAGEAPAPGASGASGAYAGLPPSGSAGFAGTHAGTPDVSAPPPRPSPGVGPLDLGLADAELGDLYTIVELSQDAAPARVSRRTADGKGVFELAMARSYAFEARLQQAWRSRGGIDGQPVLLFTAHSKRPEAFWANLTFVQGHLTYQPDRDNARQLGILQGRLGELDGGEVVLGYVVLPESWDPTNDLDVYWNDRHAAVRFP